MNRSSISEQARRAGFIARRMMLVVVATIRLAAGGSGLSNEILLSKQWHDLDASTSIAVNPSFASRIDWPTFSTAISATQMGLFALVNAQVVIPLSPFVYESHTIGFGYTGLNAGTLRKSSWQGANVVMENDAAAEGYTEHYGSVVYSFMPLRFLAIGTSFNIARQSNFGNPVTDGSVDFGTSVSLQSAFFGSHVLGVSLINPASLSRYETPVFTPDFCVSWHFEKRFDVVDIRGGFEANYRSFRGENFGTPRRDATARVGAAVNDAVSCYLQGGRRYLGIALLVNLDSTVAGVPRFMRRMTGACQILFTEEQMRPTSTLYFSGEVNRNRNTVSGDAYDIYLRAVAAFTAEKWVDAYALFSLLDKEVPEFPKIDEVRLYRATCLERMFLYDRSIDLYKLVRTRFRYGSSDDAQRILGAADLGLLRLYAKCSDTTGFRKMLEFLRYSPVDDSLRQHAWYIAGQFALDHGDTVGGLDYFARVKQDHPDFPFAQYAKGVCHVVTNDADRLIEKCFKEAAEFNSGDEAAKEISYRACYALGCFYYERNRFADAQRYIERIPEESGVYYDGLSVVTWALLKSRQWNRCRISAKRMQESNSPDIRSEGYLLEGYSLMCDTARTQPRLLCLAHALETADEAARLLPSIDTYAGADVRKLEYENDSLAGAEWALLEKYHAMLDDGAEHASLFKCIDGIRAPARYCQYRTDINLFNIDIADHYRNNRARIAMLREDVNYFAAKVKMLYEREKFYNSGRRDVTAGNDQR